MKRMLLFVIAACLGLFSYSCSDDDDDAFVEEGVESLSDIVPSGILSRMGEYMDFPQGGNPPEVNGIYLIRPAVVVYCSDEGKGGWKPGKQLGTKTIEFTGQDTGRGRLEVKEKYVYEDEVNPGKGAYIFGSGNKFTAAFRIAKTEKGIKQKLAVVVTGKKTAKGLEMMRYAFIMLEKGADPENKLMDVGTFRIIRDEDECAENSSWQ